MITTSEFDLYLGDKAQIQGYRVRSFNRDSAPQIAPRFSTGAEGQTELDLLKSTSVDDFVGGMFQRDWHDNTKVARAIGMYNPYDAMLYPALAPTTNTTLGLGRVLAKVENELYTFIATGRYNVGTGAGFGYVSRLYRFDKNTSTLTQITLPTAFTTNAQALISDLALHKEFLYISTQASASAYVTNYRMKVIDNTFQDLSGYGVLMRSLRGVLYHINIQSYIYSMTNEAAATAATYTFLDIAGQSDPTIAAPTDATEFNGALWIAKPEGIFRFDGIKAVKVLNLRTRKLTPFNGAIYFVARQWLYKFDGSNVTRLQFFGYGETFSDLSLSANADYLFIQTFTPSGTYQAETDKIASAAGLRRIYTYDGQAFLMISEASMAGLYQPPSFGLLYTEDTLIDFYTIAQSASDTAQHDMYYNRFDLRKYFIAANVTTAAQLDVTTSEFDAGYPNVFKSANVIELSYRNMIAGDTLTVSYQIFDGKNWSAWTTLGAITSASDNKLEITDNTKMLFKRIKISVTGSFAAGSTFSMKGVSLRWTLQPRVRWRWQTALVAHGLNTDNRMGNVITSTANTLNNLITQAVKQKTPLYMLSPDYGVTKTTVTAAATSIQIDGEVPVYSDPYQEYPLVAIKNDNNAWEILRVTSAIYDGTKTTLTVAERGYLGITAAAITAGKEFHLCYRVYVTRLVSDSPILDEETYDEQSTKNSQLKREFRLEIIEV